MFTQFQNLLTWAVLFLIFFLWTGTNFVMAKDATIASQYSTLWKGCAEKDIKVAEGYEIVEARCRGVLGYHLLLSEEDIRQTVNVISPDGKEHPLLFYQVVTGAPSYLGKKAEWRVQKFKKKAEAPRPHHSSQCLFLPGGEKGSDLLFDRLKDLAWKNLCHASCSTRTYPK